MTTAPAITITLDDNCCQENNLPVDLGVHKRWVYWEREDGKRVEHVVVTPANQFDMPGEALPDGRFRIFYKGTYMTWRTRTRCEGNVVCPAGADVEPPEMSNGPG